MERTNRKDSEDKETQISQKQAGDNGAGLLTQLQGLAPASAARDWHCCDPL